MHSIVLPDLTPDDLAALDAADRSTRDVRFRTRVQMVLLAAEQQVTAPAIAVIVRVDEETVRRWLTRYASEGIEGLRDAPRPGTPVKVTAASGEQVLAAVRRRPRRRDVPFSLWTLHRLAEYLAEQTGIRVTHETVRRHLHAAGIGLSRPQHTITSPAVRPSPMPTKSI